MCMRDKKKNSPNSGIHWKLSIYWMVSSEAQWPLNKIEIQQDLKSHCAEILSKNSTLCQHSAKHKQNTTVHFSMRHNLFRCMLTLWIMTMIITHTEKERKRKHGRNILYPKKPNCIEKNLIKKMVFQMDFEMQ